MIGVDHFANVPATLTVHMVGRRYRIVRATVVDGVLSADSIGSVTYPSIGAARQALRSMLASRNPTHKDERDG